MTKAKTATPKKALTISLDADLHDQFADLAARAGFSKNQMVSFAIRVFMRDGSKAIGQILMGRRV